MSKSDADAVIGLYEKHASAWMSKRGQNLIERVWLDRFLSIARTGGQEVLDLGCGSGQPIAAYLIRNGCKVTGIDAASILLNAAQKEFPEQTWIAADMRQLPPLPKFHGVMAWHSLFHLKPVEQRLMFETFGGLCRAGAPLLFTSGTTFGEKLGIFEGEPLYHGSLDPEEYRALLNGNGFSVINYTEEDPTCGSATIWLARKDLV